MKKILSLMFVLVFAMTISLPAFAQVNTGNIDVWGLEGANAPAEGYVTEETGFGDTDPRQMAASVINVMLGFLGIIAVVIILLGGFKWMTAAGNEDKVGEAKKLLAAGVIGLIIILMSYGLAQFVLSALVDATGGAA